MAIPRPSLRSSMSRAAQREQKIGLLLTGVRTKHQPQITEASGAETLDQDNQSEQVAALISREDRESSTQSRFENDSMDGTEVEAADEPSESPTPSSSELSGEPEGESNDESTAQAQGPPGDKESNSLADILANPLPPAPSVDNIISDTLGNIFQKKVTRDPIMQALLDQHDKVGMSELAAELREFADEIRASKDPT